MPDKAKLNFIIDALMFVCMTAIAGLGFLMKFILIPGKERWAKYGRSVELLFFGMDRHEWGTIHLGIAFTLIGLLALHVILHWKVIAGLFQKMVDNQKTRRLAAPAFAMVSLFLLFAPLAVKPEIQEIERGQGRLEHGSLTTPEAGNIGCGGCPEMAAHEAAHPIDSHGEVRGFMTLAEVSEKYDVPIHCLKTHLGIPESAPETEKLGRLRDAYDFTMSDVESAIARYREEQ